jgi:hypothetical protein
VGRLDAEGWHAVDPRPAAAVGWVDWMPRGGTRSTHVRREVAAGIRPAGLATLPGVAAPPVVRLDPAVLRQALGATLVLREGQVLGGRVAEVNGRHGILLLRGAPVVAELPEGLRRGQAVRLAVTGAGDDGKVVLRLLPETTAATQPQQAAPPTPPAQPWIALPGGARLRVEEDDEPAGPGGADEGPAARSVRVRFEGAALGPVDLHLGLDVAGRVRTTVHASPAALAALRAARGELGGDVRLQSRAGELDARA